MAKLSSCAAAALACAALACAALSLACAPVQAQTLRERLAERMGARQEAAPSAGQGAGEEESGTSVGGFLSEMMDMGANNKPWAEPMPAWIEARRDIAYGADAGERLDIYRPSGAGPVPVIVMVHGGGWRRGDKLSSAVARNKVLDWVPRGAAVVSINYPMLPDTDPYRQAFAVAKALAWLQANAASHGLDMSRAALVGHSAGAHLAALVAASPEIRSSYGFSMPLRGVVPLDAGGLDTVETMSGRHFKLYDQAFGADPAYWAKASPMAQMRSAPPPLMMVCSSKRKDSCPQNEAFQAKARSLGADADSIRVPMTHGEINKDLGVPSDYTSHVDAFLVRVGVLPR